MIARGILAGLALALSSCLLPAQGATTTARPPSSQSPAPPGAASESGPPPNPGIFPLGQVRRGQTGTAWTVFEGTAPEPMQVEILGVLRGARGPGQDLILARLHGAKPDYTGVVAGMSGSPVYIDGKLAGSISYRIGQFAKEAIAGITPIEQMLEVRDLPAGDGASAETAAAEAAQPESLGGDRQLASNPLTGSSTTVQPMETPLVMSGFRPDAIRFWEEQTAGTSLGPVAAGGSLSGMASSGSSAPSPAAPALEPGSAVSMQLIRGDLEVAATCTVTYVDPKQLLACGHPVLGAGPVSLPMTTAEVVTTLASPLDSFKIINTGATVGAFTEDRESAIRGVLGAEAHMIPVHIAIDAPEGPRKVNVEILDLPSLTPLAAQVVVYDSLLESNQSTEAKSYHVTGSIDVAGFAAVPLDLWAPAGESMPATMQAAMLAGSQFTRLYSNGARQGAIRAIDLHIQAVPRNVQVALDAVRLVSADIVHAGDTIEVEATVRPWHGAERNVRIPVKLPARLATGNLRVLVSDATTLDRTLRQPRAFGGAEADLAQVLVEARNQHPADRIYVSLLAPETQAEIRGQTLTSLPLSVANALEPMRNQQSAGLNGESAELAGEAPAGGVLSGFQVLNLHIEPGGGLN
ncbi:MAG: SpoIVB peptidase S55 [Terracidiphilus sp.]